MHNIIKFEPSWLAEYNKLHSTGVVDYVNGFIWPSGMNLSEFIDSDQPFMSQCKGRRLTCTIKISSWINTYIFGIEPMEAAIDEINRHLLIVAQDGPLWDDEGKGDLVIRLGIEDNKLAMLRVLLPNATYTYYFSTLVRTDSADAQLARLKESQLARIREACHE